MSKEIDNNKIYSIFLDHYEMCKKDPETIIMQRASHNPIKSPLFISWEITSECNLSCRHCRAAFNNSRNKQEYPSLEEYIRVIRSLGRNELYRIGITGGEPFLHPYIFDILSACKKENLDIILYTNATLVGAKEADMLASILSQTDIVHVSLDGGNCKDNDAQRGEGVFSKIINGLEELSKRFINIRLNVVPTIYNQNSILDICDIAIRYNVKEFGASPLMTSGRARLSNMVPDYKKLFHTEMQVVDKLKNTKVKYIGGISGTVHNLLNLPNFVDSGYYTLKREASALKICDAANRKMFIDAIGDCYPCSLFAENLEFVGGNIFSTPLNEIWNNDKWRIFREGVEVSSSKCKDCRIYSLCNGGCMALAYKASGSMGSIDPRCPNA